MSNPLVSVLMTAYNREKYIADAIESVLATTYTNFELIVVDDCSTDRTVEIATRYEAKDKRVKIYVNKKNLGDYPNRNKAASYVNGKYIKYLDSDDIMKTECLAIMVAAMEQFPEAGVGLSKKGVNKMEEVKCLTPAEAYKDHFWGSGIFNRAPGSSIINNKVFKKLCGFSGINQIGDFEFWLRAAIYFPVVTLPVDLYISRDHPDRQLKTNTDKEKRNLKFEVLKEIFQNSQVPLTNSEKKEILHSYRGYQITYFRKLFKSIFS